MAKRYFVTGIGTGIGKTIVSAILVEKLSADYWKPIQSGDLENSDTKNVKSLITNGISIFHPEVYRLTQPFSPHKSAKIDAIEIDIDKINAPSTSNNLVIEGAGGLFVPLNDRYLMIDLIQKLQVEVIVVSKNYLGSINHTLLTIEALRVRNIGIKGLLFNGEEDVDTESFILNYTNVAYLGRIGALDAINKQTISASINNVRDF